MDLISRQDAINVALEFFVEFLGGAFHEDEQKELMARYHRLPSEQPEKVLVAEVKVDGEELQRCIDKAVERIKVEEKPDIIPERKKGEWIDGGWSGDWAWETDGHGCCWHQWICSECGDSSRRRTKFCPNCGKGMRGEQE